MAQKVKFHASQEVLDAYPHPYPSVKNLPDWFKNLPPSLDSHPANGSVKRCIPFLEACNQGFIIPFYCDVFVHADAEKIDFEFAEKNLCDGMSPHSKEQVEGHPFENFKYGKVPLKWHNPWVIQTPKGYSCYFVSPFNRLEDRFKLFDGVVDTDNYYNNINFPFIWTAGEGEYLIEKGTPMVQVIPFKRDTIKHEVGVMDNRKRNKINNKLQTLFNNKYRRLFWHKTEKER
jgi:hypothetical protein|tara:strand:- start:82 stop:774 length:693 start_codon:yes stop_codon:yes gene_type:complete